MNTCEKNDHYYYFLFIQRYRTSYSEGTATPPYLSYFCKKNTFSLIFQYSRFSRIFSYFFDDFSKSHRYVAFWRQATAIFILGQDKRRQQRKGVHFVDSQELLIIEVECEEHLEDILQSDCSKGLPIFAAKFKEHVETILQNHS